MAFKCWKKENNLKMEWNHSDGERMLVTRPKNDIPAKWIAGSTGMLHIRKFKTKSLALKFAEAYMKKNDRC